MTRQLLPLATGAVTLVAMWLAGNKRSLGWAVGLANQGLWAVFIVVFEAWGLAPLTAALTVTYARNLLKWRREAENYTSWPRRPPRNSVTPWWPPPTGSSS